ncbi:MAG: hypothetical protein NTX64_18135 [Elusimicrobia bacterium]|nr:hypothetical protein [Elusimicrobiota bacterium]
MRLWGVVKAGAVALALCYVAVIGSRFGLWGRLLQLAHPAGPPPRTMPLPYGAEILQKRETEMVQRVTQEYARVKALVDEARRQGLNVADLDRNLLVSLSMARRKQYDRALTMLNKIEIGLPRKGEGVVAARIDDPLPGGPEIRTKPAQEPARRQRKRD